ncbi:MAG: biotin synthase BioB [Simkaniaceae bacterium]
MLRHDWSLAELKEIYELPLLDLVFRAAKVHRRFQDAREIQLCHLISIKTGGCTEDCKYCAQSARYQTKVKAEPFMNLDEVVQRARRAQRLGTTRVCLGAAWRQVRESRQWGKILAMIRQLTEDGIEVCCTLGMLQEPQAKQLKEAGLYAYNHNLDTSDWYYPKIISTRSFTERLLTLAKIRSAGIFLCTGGIVGLGEKKEDRLRLLQILSSFTPHPESVPINRLEAMKGTPLEGTPKISVWELIRTIALARIIMPKTMVRLAAGRRHMSDFAQALCFLAGANSIFIGEKLLTAENASLEEDLQLLQTLSLRPRPSFKEQSKNA